MRRVRSDTLPAIAKPQGNATVQAPARGAVAGTLPLVTPDGRYIVVRGRLWRRANPSLPGPRRQALVDALMAARRAVGRARHAGAAAMAEARAAVDAAKVALGERGPVWWSDGTPDLTRHMARTTGYADWYAAQTVVP